MPAPASKRRRRDVESSAALGRNLTDSEDDPGLEDDDNDGESLLGDDIEDDQAGNEGGGSTASRNVLYTPECLADLDELEHDFYLKAQQICHNHGIAMTSVRQRLGFAVEIGRETNDSTRHSRWFARTQTNPHPGDLRKRNQHVKSEWDKVKDDADKRAALLRKIKQWERKHLAGANEMTAKKSMIKARRSANKFARSLWQNHGISGLVMIAHPHSMMTPLCIAHQGTHTAFANAFRSAETVLHLRQEFQNEIRKKPLPNTTAPQKGSKSGPNPFEPADLDPESQTFATIRKTAPRKLLGAIRAAIEEHDKDSSAWDLAAKGTRRMVWDRTFDLLADVGLCVEGWPTSAAFLLLDQAKTTTVTVLDSSGPASTTLRILSGSLQCNSLWSKPIARRLWGAICRAEVRVVPVPSVDE